MGMSWQDAAEWDFVEYGKALRVWNERQKEAAGDEAGENSEPPPIEWMIADDVRADAKGHKVH